MPPPDVLLLIGGDPTPLFNQIRQLQSQIQALTGTSGVQLTLPFQQAAASASTLQQTLGRVAASAASVGTSATVIATATGNAVAQAVLFRAQTNQIEASYARIAKNPLTNPADVARIKQFVDQLKISGQAVPKDVFAGWALDASRVQRSLEFQAATMKNMAGIVAGVASAEAQRVVQLRVIEQSLQRIAALEAKSGQLGPNKVSTDLLALQSQLSAPGASPLSKEQFVAVRGEVDKLTTSLKASAAQSIATNSAFDNLFSGFLRYIKIAGLLTVVYGGMRAVMSGVQFISDVDLAMRKLAGTTLDQTEKAQLQVQGLQLVRRGMTEYGLSIEQATGLTFELSKALGGNAQLVQSAFLPALSLILSGEVDQQQAVRVLVGLYTQFGESLTGAATPAEKMAQITNILHLGANLSAGSIKTLLDSLQYVAGQADVSGIKLEHLVAVLAVLQNRLSAASRTGTGVSQVLAEMSRNTQALAEFFGFANEIDMTKPVDQLALLVRVLQEIRKQMGDSAELTPEFANQLKKVLPGIQEIRVLGQLAKTGIDDIAKAMAGIRPEAQATANALDEYKKAISSAAAAMKNELLFTLQELFKIVTTPEGLVKGFKSIQEAIAEAGKDAKLWLETITEIYRILRGPKVQIDPGTATLPPEARDLIERLQGRDRLFGVLASPFKAPPGLDKFIESLKRFNDASEGVTKSLGPTEQATDSFGNASEEAAAKIMLFGRALQDSEGGAAKRAKDLSEALSEIRRETDRQNPAFGIYKQLDIALKDAAVSAGKASEAIAKYNAGALDIKTVTTAVKEAEADQLKASRLTVEIEKQRTELLMARAKEARDAADAIITLETEVAALLKTTAREGEEGSAFIATQEAQSRQFIERLSAANEILGLSEDRIRSLIQLFDELQKKQVQIFADNQVRTIVAGVETESESLIRAFVEQRKKIADLISSGAVTSAQGDELNAALERLVEKQSGVAQLEQNLRTLNSTLGLTAGEAAKATIAAKFGFDTFDDMVRASTDDLVKNADVLRRWVVIAERAATVAEGAQTGQLRKDVDEAEQALRVLSATLTKTGEAAIREELAIRLFKKSFDDLNASTDETDKQNAALIITLARLRQAATEASQAAALLAAGFDEKAVPSMIRTNAEIEKYIANQEVAIQVITNLNTATSRVFDAQLRLQEQIARSQGDLWSVFLINLAKAGGATETIFKDLEKLAAGTARTMGQFFDDFLFDVFTNRAAGLRDVFRSMLSSMMRELTSFMSSQIVRGFMQLIVGGGGQLSASSVASIQAGGGATGGGAPAQAGGGGGGSGLSTILNLGSSALSGGSSFNPFGGGSGIVAGVMNVSGNFVANGIPGVLVGAQGLGADVGIVAGSAGSLASDVGTQGLIGFGGAISSATVALAAVTAAMNIFGGIMDIVNGKTNQGIATLAGGAVGGTALGVAGGLGLGASLGVAGGPIGAVIGAVIGVALGSTLGKFLGGFLPENIPKKDREKIELKDFADDLQPFIRSIQTARTADRLFQALADVAPRPLGGVSPSQVVGHVFDPRTGAPLTIGRQPGSQAGQGEWPGWSIGQDQLLSDPRRLMSILRSRPDALSFDAVVGVELEDSQKTVAEIQKQLKDMVTEIVKAIEQVEGIRKALFVDVGRAAQQILPAGLFEQFKANLLDPLQSTFDAVLAMNEPWNEIESQITQIGQTVASYAGLVALYGQLTQDVARYSGDYVKAIGSITLQQKQALQGINQGVSDTAQRVGFTASEVAAIDLDPAALQAAIQRVLNEMVLAPDELLQRLSGLREAVVSRYELEKKLVLEQEANIAAFYETQGKGFVELTLLLGRMEIASTGVSQPLAQLIEDMAHLATTSLSTSEALAAVTYGFQLVLQSLPSQIQGQQLAGGDPTGGLGLTDIFAKVLHDIEPFSVGLTQLIGQAIEAGDLGNAFNLMTQFGQLLNQAMNAAIDGVRQWEQIQVDAINTAADAEIKKVEDERKRQLDLTQVQIDAAQQQLDIIDQQRFGIETQKWALEDQLKVYEKMYKAAIKVYQAQLDQADVQLQTIEDQRWGLEQQRWLIEDQISALKKVADPIEQAMDALSRAQKEIQRSIDAASRVIRSINDAIQPLQDALDAINDEIAQVRRESDDQLWVIREQTKALTDQRDVLQAQIDLIQEWSDAVAGMRGFLHDLALSTQAPPDAIGQYDLARQTFDRLMADFLETPSAQELSQLQKAAGDVLTAAEPLFARPSAEYRNLYESIVRQLEAAQGIGQGLGGDPDAMQALIDQVTALTDQIDALNKSAEDISWATEQQVHLLELQGRAIQDQIDILTDQRTVVERQIDLLQRQVDDLDDQKAVLQEQLDAVHEQTQLLQDQLDVLDDVEKGLSRQEAILNRNKTEIQRQIDAINDLYDQAKGGLEDQLAALDDIDLGLGRQETILQRHLDRLNDQIAAINHDSDFNISAINQSRDDQIVAIRDAADTQVDFIKNSMLPVFNDLSKSMGDLYEFMRVTNYNALLDLTNGQGTAAWMKKAQENAAIWIGGILNLLTGFLQGPTIEALGLFLQKPDTDTLMLTEMQNVNVNLGNIYTRLGSFSGQTPAPYEPPGGGGDGLAIGTRYARGGPATLHRGEVVIPMPYADAFRQQTAGWHEVGQGGANVSIVVSPSITIQGGGQSAEVLGQGIIDVLVKDFRQGGRSRRELMRVLGK